MGLALLGGCGGGGEDSSSSSTSQGDTTQSAVETTTAEESTLPEEPQAEVDATRERVLQERHQAEHDAKQSQAARPRGIEHHDSGGGSEQFRHQGGDNSIAEYGVEASDDEREAAAAALHGFFDSVAAQRWDTACSYMSASLLAMLEHLPEPSGQQSDLEGCPEIFAALSGGIPQSTLDAAAKADVASLRIEGERGFVLYRGAGGEAYVMPVVREEGAWRIGSLAGTPAL